MVLGQISDFPQADSLPLQGFPSVISSPVAVLSRDRTDEPALESLVRRFGSWILLPECWRDIFPKAGVLISSAICGGTLEHRLSSALQAAPNRCWLLLEPMCMEFSFPCPTGIGIPVSPPTAVPAFYSEALSCYYTHSQHSDSGRFTLFDTSETLTQKVQLAKELGFCGFVYDDTF